MKLHWSPKSPYVRKVMVIAHETGVAGRIDCVRSVAFMTKVNPEIQADNPLGKIPTLVLDDGREVFDSLVICQHFARIGADTGIFPDDPDAHLDAMVRHALGQGATDALILWRNELNRTPEQQLPELLSSLEFKVAASLDRLEAEAPRMETLAFDIGAAAIGVMLSYMDFRFEDYGWREGRPNLARWHRAFEARPSVQATVVVDA